MLQSLAVFPLKRVSQARRQFTWIMFPYAGPFSAGLLRQNAHLLPESRRATGMLASAPSYWIR